MKLDWVPRIRGKVGQAEAPEHVKGKWYFTMWVSEMGKGEGEEVGTIGPFDTEAIALAELKKAVQLASEHFEEHLTGEVSGKYLDMKTNEMRQWGDEN